MSWLLKQVQKNAALRGQLKWPPKRTAEDSGLSVAQVCVARRCFRRASRVPAIFVLIAVFDGPMSVVVSGGAF